MVTLQQIGKEHKVLRSLHNAWKNSLLPKLLKIFLPRDSSSGIKKIYVQNKIVCKGKTLEERFAAVNQL